MWAFKAQRVVKGLRSILFFLTADPCVGSCDPSRSCEGWISGRGPSSECCSLFLQQQRIPVWGGSNNHQWADCHSRDTFKGFRDIGSQISPPLHVPSRRHILPPPINVSIWYLQDSTLKPFLKVIGSQISLSLLFQFKFQDPAEILAPGLPLPS